jgi:hypothetical protein
MLWLMKTLRFFHFAAALVAIFLVQQASAAVVAAGTHVVVQTTATITSVDARGTRVAAVLARPLLSQGRVVAPAGSKVMAHVASSRRQYHSKERLTVDMTEIFFNGRGHRVRTTGPALVDNRNWTTSTGATITRGGYAVRAGRHLHFQLAEPLVF